MNPYVTVSYAQSIDGRIATITGDSRWISGSATLKLAHRLRRESDAILVGVGTVLRDNPLLTCRAGRCSPLLRVILDSQLRTPPDSQIAETACLHRTVIFTSEAGYDAPEREFFRREAALRERDIEVIPVPVYSGAPNEGAVSEYSGVLDIEAVLGKLADDGVRKLVVEGGGKVISGFLRRGMVDRMLVVTAPIFIGNGVSAVEDLGVTELSGALRPKVRRIRRYGGDFVWDLRFRR